MKAVQQRRISGLLLLSLSLIAFAAAAEPAREMSALGQRLFSGQEQLSGRIYTHEVDMPSAVTRCSNCHAAGNGPAVPRSLAPRLTRRLLLDTMPRRGGPPTKYNRAGFCTLLGKGVDPAYVVIDVAMPRYKLNEQQCTALWAFLTGDTE